MRVVGTLAAMVMVLACSTPAQAQIIGSFSWQMQPYCNKVTVTVIQQGGLYQLSGVDDVCGTGTAPVTGTAVPAPGGSVAMGFTVVQPFGGVTHVSAEIALNTLSGTWRDEGGTVGSFVFGANSGGPQRPTPQLLGAVTGGNGEGVGGTVCTVSGGVEIVTKNALGMPVDARFSFIIPGHSHGQIRESGSIRNSTANLTSVQHPGPGLYCLVFSSAPTQVQAEATVVSIHSGQ